MPGKHVLIHLFTESLIHYHNHPSNIYQEPMMCQVSLLDVGDTMVGHSTDPLLKELTIEARR